MQAGQHLGPETSWREATKGSQKDQEPLAGTARSGQEFSSSVTPRVLGLSPGHLPVNPSFPPPTPSQTSPSSKHLHLLPGRRRPPPPATSDSPQLPRVQEQHLYRPVEAHASWVDGCCTTGWHVGRKTHRPGTKEPSDHWKTKSL